jgi:predicted Zn-dependent peptidase
VITVEQPHLHSASIALYVRCGSRYETLNQWGLSHFLEHMLFRGSAKYPDSHKLTEIFERSGDLLDASTWRDHTSFSMTLHPSELGVALAALADMITHPLFADLELERRVVAEELHSDLDEDGNDICPHNVSRANIWHENPLGRRITGSPDRIEHFSVEDLRAHHRTHYVGHNIVLCVAGRIRREEVELLAADLFSQIPAASTVAWVPAPATFAPSKKISTHELRGSQLSAQLTFESLPYGHPDFTALELLVRILDSGMSSRLHQAICERRGLVYQLSTELDCYSDCGLYDISLKAAPKRTALAIEAILQTLKELCDKGISAHEIDEARKQSLHAIEFRVDSSLDLADQYGGGALFGCADTLERETARLHATTTDDLLRVAQQMFSRTHLTLVGPLSRTPLDQIENVVEGF